MASYSAARAKHITLVAATMDDVTITGEYAQLTILNRDGSNPIYVRYGRGATAADIPTPTVAGDDTIIIPANGSIVVDFPFRYATATNAIVKVIGAGTGGVSVQGI